MMKENREWIRKDAGLRWEIAQIEASGPNFREQLAAAAGVEAGGVEAGAAPTGGGGSAGGSEIPEFGGSSAAPETETGTAPVGAEGGAGTPPEAGPPTQATGASTPSTPPA